MQELEDSCSLPRRSPLLHLAGDLLHGPNDPLVAELGELPFAVKAGEGGNFHQRVGSRDGALAVAQLRLVPRVRGTRSKKVVVSFPQRVHLGPFLFGQAMDLGRSTVVFTGAHQVVRVLAPGRIPIGPQPLARRHITISGEIRFREDGEVRVTELDGPLIMAVRQQDGRDVGRGWRARAQAPLPMERGDGWALG